MANEEDETIEFDEPAQSCELCPLSDDLPADGYYQVSSGSLRAICDDCVAALLPQLLVRLLGMAGYEMSDE